MLKIIDLYPGDVLQLDIHASNNKDGFLKSVSITVDEGFYIINEGDE